MAVVFVLFWIAGATYEAVNFNCDIRDFVILSVGFVSTIAMILHIPPYLLLGLAENGVEKYKKELLGTICGNVRSFAPFAIGAGALTLVFEHISTLAVPYAIVPEIFGVINVIVLIFCPSEDIFR